MRDYIKREGKQDVIVIDKSKFTQEDLNILEEYRELALRVHTLERCFVAKYYDAKSKKEENSWLKCMDLLDQVRSIYEDNMFDEYPQLPDSSMKLFY